MQRAVKIFEQLNPSVHSTDVDRDGPWNIGLFAIHHLMQLLAREYFIELSPKLCIVFGCLLPAEETAFLMGCLWWADLNNKMSEISSIMLYAFFWVILRHLNFICQRFGTLCLFHLQRQVGMKNDWVKNSGVFIWEKVWLENGLRQ